MALHALRSGLSRLRWIVVNGIAYWRHRGPAPQGRATAYFDLEGDHFHRYLLNFLHFLHVQDYRILIRWTPGFMGSWATRELLRQLPSIRFVTSPAGPSGASLRFTDRGPRENFIHLDADYFVDLPDDATAYTLPMSMVDTFYHERSHDRPAPSAERVREQAVIFFGNTDPEHYDRPVLQEVFGCASRHALLTAIANEFPRRILRPGTPEEAHGQDGADILIMERAVRYIRPTELRPLLERFDFFLAAPGVVMPLCHNLIEAMSVGCIPILQHAHLLRPPLQHGVDCLSFKDLGEAKQRMNDLRRMDKDIIVRMRANVLAYYKKYLTPEAVVGHIEQRAGTLRTLRMNAEWPSVQLLRQRLSARTTDHLNRS